MVLVKLKYKINDKMIMRTQESFFLNSEICLKANENHHYVMLSHMLSIIYVKFYELLSYYCCLYCVSTVLFTFYH